MYILSDVDKKLLEELQNDFPLVSQPFKYIAEKCNLTENQVIERVIGYQENKIVREISAIIDGKAIGYKNTLVAVQTQKDSIDTILDKFTKEAIK